MISSYLAIAIYTSDQGETEYICFGGAHILTSIPFANLFNMACLYDDAINVAYGQGSAAINVV